MTSRTSRRLPLVVGGIALSAMAFLAGCGSNGGNAPESTTTTTTTTTTTAPPATSPAPVSPTENAPRLPGGNPFTTIPPNVNDNGRNPNAPRSPGN